MKEPTQRSMDELQEQINALRHAIERMPEQIAALLIAAEEVKIPAPSRVAAQTLDSSREESYSFLIDEDMPSTSTRLMGQEIAPEAQVQRLTAQLTAAYNRIAALEEQLLAQRMPH